MEVKYIKCPEPTDTPCLMKSTHGEIFLVTDGPQQNYYVTRVGQGADGMETWESDLEGYTPLPKGTKIEIIN